jgi:hypothetical protein
VSPEGRAHTHEALHVTLFDSSSMLGHLDGAISEKGALARHQSSWYLGLRLPSLQNGKKMNFYSL